MLSRVVYNLVMQLNLPFIKTEFDLVANQKGSKQLWKICLNCLKVVSVNKSNRHRLSDLLPLSLDLLNCQQLSIDYRNRTYRQRARRKTWTTKNNLWMYYIYCKRVFTSHIMISYPGCAAPSLTILVNTSFLNNLISSSSGTGFHTHTGDSDIDTQMIIYLQLLGALKA